MFWNWFAANSDIVFNFENNQEVVFKKLTKQIKKVNSNLTFEIGPIHNGKREFIISADGIQKAFKSVEKLYSKKIELKKWHIIKFPPRRKNLLSIKIGKLEIKPSDLQYLFFVDENPKKIGLLVLINNYDKSQYNVYSKIVYLFLDQILGEFDVETYLGAIEIQGFDSEYFNKTKEISDMANNFDLLKPEWESHEKKITLRRSKEIEYLWQNSKLSDNEKYIFEFQLFGTNKDKIEPLIEKLKETYDVKLYFDDKNNINYINCTTKPIEVDLSLEKLLSWNSFINELAFTFKYQLSNVTLYKEQSPDLKYTTKDIDLE